MNKQVFSIIGVVVLFVGSVFLVYSMNQPKNQAVLRTLTKKDFIYFYGVTCPHCKVLNKFLEDKGINKKVKYEKLEVFYNEDNAALMKQAADMCKINPSGMGVPFILDKGKCYVGTPDAEKLFMEKFKLAK